jgi:hypothetical protein
MKLLNLLFLSASFMFVVSCANQNPETKKEQAIKADQKIKKYECPHHCIAGKTYDNPGTCPVCSRTLTVMEIKR